MRFIKYLSFLLFSILNKINLHFKLRFIGNFLDSIRMILLKFAGASIGKNSVVGANVLIINPKNLIIGNNSTIGSNSEIFNYKKVVIGDNVDIGTQFYVNTNNHKIDNPNLPLAYQGTISDEIVIGSDIWIGARVIILFGGKIQNRVVIGAGTIITKELQTGYVYAGTPAKQINKLIN